MKPTIRFALAYTPLDIKPTAGTGSCLWVQNPVYLTFDPHPFARSLNWMTNEPITLIEALQFAMQYHIAVDSVTLVENLAFSMGYHLADTFSFTESFVPRVQSLRSFADSVALGNEQVRFNFRPGEMVETVTLNEQFAIHYTLRFNETIKIVEIFSNGKSQTFDDSFRVVEHGMLVSQNYFDTNTYFATDYFGESRTW